MSKFLVKKSEVMVDLSLNWVVTEGCEKNSVPALCNGRQYRGLFASGCIFFSLIIFSFMRYSKIIHCTAVPSQLC